MLSHKGLLYNIHEVPVLSNAMVTNYLRAPYGDLFTQIVRFYRARTAPGQRQEELYDFLSNF